MSNLKLLSKARTRLLSTSWMTSSMLTVTAKKKLKKTTVMVLLDTRKIQCRIMPRFNNKCKVKRSLNKQLFLLPNLTAMSFLVSPSISMLTLLVPVTSRSKRISSVIYSIHIPVLLKMSLNMMLHLSSAPYWKVYLMVLLIFNALILQIKIFLLKEWVCFVKDSYTWAH